MPLYEEAGDPGVYQIGHGLSYLIKTDTATILMDLGNNPAEADAAPLASNMQALGVSWDQIDAVIVSHFHPDHVGGVAAWKSGKVSLGKETVDFQGKPVYAAEGAEQTLAVKVAGKGILLVMGCGHPIMERIVARAEALFEHEEGIMFWSFTDPLGEVRWEGEQGQAAIFDETRDFDRVWGEWRLEIEAEDRSGSYDQCWMAR